jgi:hypothetical protein
MNKRSLHAFFSTLAAIGLAWVTAAQATNLSELPLKVSALAKPNIIFGMDDSGSMDWEVILDTASGPAYWNGTSLVPDSDLCASSAAGIPNEPDGQSPAVKSAPQQKDAPFSLAPNPAGSFVNVRIEPLEEEQEATMEVYNQYGQLVLRKEFGVIGQLNDRVDVRQFNSGMYIISLKLGGERFEDKLLINNY